MSAGMPTVEFHGYTPAGAGKHYGSSDIDAPVDATPFVTRLAWTQSVNAPWETITLDMRVPRRLWLDLFPGPKVQGGRTPQTGFWVVVREPGTNTALAWGRCVKLSTGFGADEIGRVETVPVRVECASWLSLLERTRLLLAPAPAALEARGFVYKMQSWAPQIKALLEGVADQIPGNAFAKLWEGNGRGDGIVALTVPTSLVSGEDGAPLEIGDQIPLIYTSARAQQYAPQRYNCHKTVPGQAIRAMGAAIPYANLWDWLRNTFQGDPALVELFPALEYPDAPQRRPRGLLALGEGNVANAEIAAGAGDVIPLDADGNPYVPDTAQAERRSTQLAQALGGAMPVLIYRLRPFLRFPISQESALAGAAQSRDEGDANLRPGVPASETIGAFQDPVEVLPAYGVGWYNFFPDEIVRVRLVWSEDDRVTGVFVRSPLQPQTQVAVYGWLGTPVIARGELRKHGLRMYDVDWPFLPATLLESAADVQIATPTAALDALIEAAYVCLGDGQRFARGEMQTIYKPWTKAGMWFRAQFVDITEGNADPSQTLDAYAETVTHEITVDAQTGAVQARTTVAFARGSAQGYTPIPARPRDFVTRAPDVAFGGGEGGATTSTQDYLTENITWDHVDPHRQVRVPPTHPNYAQARKYALNLQLVAESVETVARALRGLADAGQAPSFWKDTVPVVTPHGGFHGTWEEQNWTGSRTSRSQHRIGRALDVVYRGTGGLTINPNDVADVIQSLVTLGKIPSGFVRTYLGSVFVHYDTRFTGTKKPLIVQKNWTEQQGGADAKEAGGN